MDKKGHATSVESAPPDTCPKLNMAPIDNTENQQGLAYGWIHTDGIEEV